MQYDNDVDSSSAMLHWPASNMLGHVCEALYTRGDIQVHCIKNKSLCSLILSHRPPTVLTIQNTTADVIKQLKAAQAELKERLKS